MVRDDDCRIVLTLSGAMTIAKQGLVIADMIDRGWVDAVVSTGALMAHGLVESLGMSHFKHDPSMPDDELMTKGYNRVYDTIELERNLDDTERILAGVLSSLDAEVVLSDPDHVLARFTADLADLLGVSRVSLATDGAITINDLRDEPGWVNPEQAGHNHGRPGRNSSQLQLLLVAHVLPDHRLEQIV